MIKLIPPNSWDLQDQQVGVVKYASSGLRGNDLNTFIKRAGHALADWARSNPPKPGEVYVHAIALGSEEAYGPNRNGDGYPYTMLEKCGSTYEKFGYWFHNHCNNDPKKSYGRVKKAFVNKPMNRLETIAALYATKEAADRNNALVATKDLDMLDRGEDIAVSQSVKVSHDECRSCNNKAKNRKEYCDERSNCKYGGCKNNLGKVFDDGFHLYVSNPHGTFFDLSNVSDTRGADRTAFVTGKIAHVESNVGGAELAERLGLKTPVYLIAQETVNAKDHLNKLAQAQARSSAEYVPWSVVEEYRGKLELPGKQASDQDRHQFLADTAHAGIILPPHLWLHVCTNAPLEKCAEFWGSKKLSPELLLNHDDIYEILSENKLSEPDLVQAVKYAAVAPTQKTFQKLAAVSTFNSFEKASLVGADNNAREAVGLRYIAYQANALAKQSNYDRLVLMREDAVRHNITQPGCPTTV